jgi:hypothetical protein
MLFCFTHDIEVGKTDVGKFTYQREARRPRAGIRREG